MGSPVHVIRSAEPWTNTHTLSLGNCCDTRAGYNAIINAQTMSSFPSVLGTESTKKTPGKLAEMALVLRVRDKNFGHGVANAKLSHSNHVNI